MNKKVLNTAFTGLIKRLEATEKFVVAQAPEICKEMIRESMIENGMELGLTFLGFIAFPIISYKMGIYGYNHTTSSSDEMGWWMLSIVSGACAIGCFFGAFSSLQQLIFLKTCPKLFLLRSFRDLIK